MFKSRALIDFIQKVNFPKLNWLVFSFQLKGKIITVNGKIDFHYINEKTLTVRAWTFTTKDHTPGSLEDKRSIEKNIDIYEVNKNSFAFEILRLKTFWTLGSELSWARTDWDTVDRNGEHVGLILLCLRCVGAALLHHWSKLDRGGGLNALELSYIAM